MMIELMSRSSMAVRMDDLVRMQRRWRRQMKFEKNSNQGSCDAIIKTRRWSAYEIEMWNSENRNVKFEKSKYEIRKTEKWLKQNCIDAFFPGA